MNELIEAMSGVDAERGKLAKDKNELINKKYKIYFFINQKHLISSIILSSISVGITSMVF